MAVISDKVRNAAKAKQKELLAKDGVVGVMAGHEQKGGVATGREAVIILVKKKLPKEQLVDVIPMKLEDDDEIPTDVIEVGELRAFDRKGTYRPLVPGCSVGQYQITAGTLGLIVNKGGHNFILSNNHVLANENRAKIGDPVIQPGAYDGGSVGADTVAKLSEFVPVDFKNSNKVDAALAGLLSDPTSTTPAPAPAPAPKSSGNLLTKLVDAVVSLLDKVLVLLHLKKAKQVVHAQATAVFVNQPLEMKTPITKKLATVDVGDQVQKSGRTTGYTVGKVLGVDAAAQVSYDAGVADFEEQIICGPISQGGDSGSAVFDMNGNLIGLLFAGSDKVTIVNTIHNVWDALKIEEIV